MTTQELFLSRMKNLAKDRDLDFIHNPQYGNTGSFQFQRKGEWEPLVSVSYMFMGNTTDFYFEDFATSDEALPRSCYSRRGRYWRQAPDGKRLGQAHDLIRDELNLQLLRTRTTKV
jgi:hypothetical protein